MLRRPAKLVDDNGVRNGGGIQFEKNRELSKRAEYEQYEGEFSSEKGKDAEINKTNARQLGSSGDESGDNSEESEAAKVPEMKRQDSTSRQLYS